MATILKPSYGASAALTTTNLQSLASNAGLITGWSSAVIDNTSNLSVEEKISIVFKTGTTPTISTNIFTYLWEALDDAVTYPDTITGSEGSVTLTSINVRDSGAFKLVTEAIVTVDATTNRLYYCTFSVSKYFGGHMPKRWGLFILQNTGAALFSSGNVVSRDDVTQYTNV